MDDLEFNMTEESDIEDSEPIFSGMTWETFKMLVWGNPSREFNDEILNLFNDDHLNMVKVSHNMNLMLQSKTIVNQDIDGWFQKYFSKTNLRKYQWFFNNLSYFEILYINENNITFLISSVNRKCGHGHSIKKGSQKKICAFTKAMRHRSLKLIALTECFTDLAYIRMIDEDRLYRIIKYMRQILDFPIPNRHCVLGVKLQDTIITVMSNFVMVLEPRISKISFRRANGLYQRITIMFYECVRLIRENHYFDESNIKDINSYENALTTRIKSVHDSSFGKMYI